MSLLEPATNLRITSQQGPASNGDFVLGFAWDLPSSLQGIDLIFFDVAQDSGFLNYVTQHPVQNSTSFTDILNANPGRYWARVNTHYVGLGVRGWVSSNILEIVLPGAIQPATGQPASNLSLNENVLSWTPGQGLITREAIDISMFVNFDDILEAPFVQPVVQDPPIAGLALIIDALPIACDMPLNANQLILDPLPSEPFFIRVNTLFENRTWIPSQTLGQGAGFNWLVVGLITAGVIAIPYLLRGKL